MTQLAPEQLTEITERHYGAWAGSLEFLDYDTTDVGSRRVHTIRALLSHVSALTAELAALRRDAERYRWLRYRTKSLEMPDPMLSGVALDRFIDSAMSPKVLPEREG